QQCVGVLTEQLKFNICHIETSYKPNINILDLCTRIKDNISLELEYSCLYWIQHLVQCKNFDHFQKSILKSIFVNPNTLFWIECLSLLDKLNFGLKSIRKLQWWLKVCELQFLVSHSADDIYCFISKFFIPISASVPHLYISALAFAPCNSLIYKSCSKYFPQRVLVNSQSGYYWRTDDVLLSGKPEGVSRIVFEPLTNLIYSASSNDILQIWNPYSGCKVEHNIIGHSGRITVLAILYQKQVLISGSWDGIIYFWDLNALKNIYQPLTEHRSPISGLLFTQNCRTLISACAKKIVSWDLSCGFPIVQYVYSQQNIRCICLTTDDQYLICGTSKHIIIVLNMLDGTKLTEFGNPAFVIMSSMICLPTTKKLVCGTGRGWIVVWD
ncbi:WD40 repeat-like protein, partial [Pluteus cervinus]